VATHCERTAPSSAQLRACADGTPSGDVTAALSPTVRPLATGADYTEIRNSPRLFDVLGELVQTTTGKWITHPPARCPNGHELRAGRVLVGHQACLGHGGGHHLDMPRLRCHGVRPTAQHSLRDARRTRDRPPVGPAIVPPWPTRSGPRRSRGWIRSGAWSPREAQRLSAPLRLQPSQRVHLPTRAARGPSVAESSRRARKGLFPLCCR
jgi:hypothetical protein